MIPQAGTCRLSFVPAPNQRHHFAHANQTRKAGFPAPRVACLFSLHKTDSWSTQVASVPLYVRAPLRNHPVVPFRLCGALCPSFPYMASHPPVFNGEVTLFFSPPLGRWHGQQGSNLRPAVLETAALPTELCPYTRVSAQALPKSFRALCKEQSDAVSYALPENRICRAVPRDRANSSVRRAHDFAAGGL